MKKKKLLIGLLIVIGLCMIFVLNRNNVKNGVYEHKNKENPITAQLYLEEDGQFKILEGGFSSQSLIGTYEKDRNYLILTNQSDGLKMYFKIGFNKLTFDSNKTYGTRYEDKDQSFQYVGKNSK